MNIKLNNIYNRLGIKSDRTKNIAKHVSLSFLYKGGSIISSFLLIPLTINYLDTENYGIWLTISSFIAWFSFFDVGLGNGLRNKFAEAKAKGEITLAKGYISSAYFTIGAISLFLIIVFLGLNFFINWTKVFNTSPKLQKDLSLLMPILFGFFCLQLVVKLITTIYTADQNHSMQGKVNFYTQAGSVLIIWIMTKTSKASLLKFGLVFSVIPIILLFFLNLFAFNNPYREFKPSIKFCRKQYLKEIFGLGISFFIVQISWTVLTSTDNFIISKLYSPKEVVPYNLALKLFSVVTMIYSIIVTPYWSSFSESYLKKDFHWIVNSMKNLKKFMVIFSVFCLMLLAISKFLYSFWLGEKVKIPFQLSGLICIYTLLMVYLTPYNYFLNGTGKIKLQLYQSVLMAIINIPVSIFFAKSLNFGVNGIIIGTIICVIPGVILSRIQFFKIVTSTAMGIWDK